MFLFVSQVSRLDLLHAFWCVGSIGPRPAAQNSVMLVVPLSWSLIKIILSCTWKDSLILLTLRNMLQLKLCIGERYQLGSSTGPRLKACLSVLIVRKTKTAVNRGISDLRPECSMTYGRCFPLGRSYRCFRIKIGLIVAQWFEPGMAGRELVGRERFLSALPSPPPKSFCTYYVPFPWHLIGLWLCSS